MRLIDDRLLPDAYDVIVIGAGLGGMTAAVSAPIAAFMLDKFPLALMMLVLALTVLWKHQDNIRRLTAGTEPRIGRNNA